MRGIPWTGKSYTAKQLLAESGHEGFIFSTDEFWYKVNKPDLPEEYSFNPRLLGDAHHWNQQRTFRQIELGWPLLIIDNTNTMYDEFKVYVDYAIPQGYDIKIQEPTSERWLEIARLLEDKRGNKDALKQWANVLAEGSKETHSVPFWAIEKMMWRWETNDQVHQKLLETVR